MWGCLTLAEVANMIFYRIKIAFTFWAIFPDVFWKIYNDFILQ